MRLRRLVDELIGPEGAGAPDADPAGETGRAALAEGGHDRLDPQLFGEALLHYADTAPIEVADALAPVVTEASAVPFDRELDPFVSTDEAENDPTLDDVSHDDTDPDALDVERRHDDADGAAGTPDAELEQPDGVHAAATPADHDDFGRGSTLDAPLRATSDPQGDDERRDGLPSADDVADLHDPDLETPTPTVPDADVWSPDDDGFDPMDDFDEPAQLSGDDLDDPLDE